MHEDKKALSNNFRIIENWFQKNVMVLDAKNYYYMYFGNGSQNDDFIFNGIKLPNSCKEKVIMSLNLNHILEVQKQISSFLDPENKKLISNAVINSHLTYGLIIWAFSFQKFNKLRNRIHKKSLNTVYDDMMIREAHFKRFYNLLKVSVFTIGILKSYVQRCTKY